VLAVEHEHRDLLTGQVAGHQLAQRSLGLFDKPARNRRAASRFRLLLDLDTDRFGGARVSAGGHPGQHPLHHHLGQQVIGGEVRVAAQRHLAPIQSACPRPAHRHPTPAEGHRAAPAAVAHRGPVPVVLALRPGHLGDLGLKHRLHHRHPGGHAHRQQPLPRGAGDIAHCQLDLLWQIGQARGVGRVGQANSR